jgi:Metallo-peptidase family M12
MRAAPLVLALALPLLAAAIPVELTVHVAVGTDGAPVATAAWVADEVEAAGERLGPTGAAFTAAAGDATVLPAAITSVAQRDDLVALVPDDGTVHVFVVARIADKDKAGGEIGGVTWRYHGRRYILISATGARVDTLAHELGHFFGLPHTTAADNLMTPQRAPGGTLTAAQRRTVGRRLAAWARAARHAHGTAGP